MRCVFSRLGLAVPLMAAAAVAASAQTTAVPDSIEAEGTPAVPASLSAALLQYQNIRSASFQGWDDTKPRAVYIATRFADVSQIHHVAGPGASRRQLTFAADRVLGAEPRPKHDQFLFSADEGGAENYQLFLQDRTGGEPLRLTDGKSRNTSPSWSPSGELLAWSSNARNGRDMDLHLSAPADPHFHRILKEVTGDWSAADWSPDGRRLIAEEYISITESYLHIIDVSTGETRTITPRRTDPKAAPVAVGDARWSKDGRSIYYTSDKGSEFRRLARYDLATAAETWLTADVPWDVEGYDLSDDGALIAVVFNEDGPSNLRVYYAATGRERTVHKPPPGLISNLEFRADSHEIGFTVSSSQASADVFSMDFDVKSPPGSMSLTFGAEDRFRLDRWTESETGGLDVSTFVEPELIRYPTFDGEKVPAFVYRPVGRPDVPRPVLIQIHGGPESQYRPGFLGRLNYLVNELGIVVVMPNVRGSAGYGKSYLKLDDGVLREGAVKDVGALLDWIAEAPGLDKDRVAVAGGSYGGFMSLAVQTTYNDRIKAGIDVVGISNFVTFLQNTQDYRRDLRRAEYGDERVPEIRDFLERISPLARAAEIKTPILVVQGRNDPRVPFSEAEQLVAAVKKNDAPVWYVVGRNEGHGFAKKVNQDYLQAVEVLFLRKFLIGGKD